MTRPIALLLLVFVPIGVGIGSVASGATGDTPAVTNPNQAQILHVLTWANMAEIEDGKVAQTKASHAKVKELANAMVRDHTAALDKIQVLSTKMAWKPEDNALSQQMEKDHQEAKSRLASLDGASFDKAYIELQVKMHKHLLDTMDNKLLPNATDPALKALIQELRPTFVAHLDHAQKLEVEVKVWSY